MTLTVDLTNEEEARLRNKAKVAGMTPSEYARKLIVDPIKAETPAEEVDEMTIGDKIRSVLGEREPGTRTSRWSEVEAACYPH